MKERKPQARRARKPRPSPGADLIRERREEVARETQAELLDLLPRGFDAYMSGKLVKK